MTPTSGRARGATRSVAVVGAGAVGTTTASDLADRGADVTLFDAGTVASGSTGRAAGVVYDAFAEDVDAAIADRALERFRAFDGGGEFSFTECPYVWLAREGDDRRATAIRKQVERMRANGRDVSLVDPPDLAAEWPALRTDDVAVAAVARNAGYVEPATYAELLAEEAASAGATVRENEPVAVETDPLRVGGARFDAVVVAAGAHTPGLLADAGHPVACKPYRVQALTTEAAPDVPMVYDATAGFYCRPRGEGLLAGDGTEEREADPDAYERAADPGFRADTVERLGHRVPGGHAVADAWAGLCTATPDRDPLLGEVVDGLYVATGWHGHGFMRAPATAERLATAVLGGEGVPAFDPTRFTGTEEFEVVEGMTVD